MRTDSLNESNDPALVPQPAASGARRHSVAHAQCGGGDFQRNMKVRGAGWWGEDGSVMLLPSTAWHSVGMFTITSCSYRGNQKVLAGWCTVKLCGVCGFTGPWNCANVSSAVLAASDNVTCHRWCRNELSYSRVATLLMSIHLITTSWEIRSDWLARWQMYLLWVKETVRLAVWLTLAMQCR